jgi:hypothetical protein
MSIVEDNPIQTTSIDPANQSLMALLGAIPGVRVSAYISRPLGQRVIEVAIPEGDTNAEMAIYRAELETYQQFPDARIELYVV